MPEVTIKYKKPETLKILKGLAKYFDFKISASTEKKKDSIDDILIPGNKRLDISELEKVFTGKDLDAKKLREDLWQRKR
ncbi:hypothetical protein ACEN9X_16820 [Mucilaginibacter sp. Mucisp86]|uniref:hypothetical protein n=1 Tax=Mucilaginibacter sp. Mucisp86 TaxID=3243060 RepID=UPI0039B37E0F